jgi:hypothetical protein
MMAAPLSMSMATRPKFEPLLVDGEPLLVDGERRLIPGGYRSSM